MKQKIKFALISALLVFNCLYVATAFVVPTVSAACGDAATSTEFAQENEGDCADKTAFSFGNCGKDDVGIECVVDEILKFLTAAVGIAVVAGVTVGGIMYSTSRGNPAGTQKGKTIISNSIIGLVMYLLMFAIINFMVPGGVFG